MTNPSSNRRSSSGAPKSSHKDATGSTAASVRLAEMFQDLPVEFYKQNLFESIKPLVSTLFLSSLAYYVAIRLPFYSLPFVWLLLGGLYVGLCAIALDCAKDTFSPWPLVNELVGTFVCLPLLLPYQSWRLHLRGRRFERILHSFANGKLWWLASFTEWAQSNFDFASVWSQSDSRLLTSLISFWTSSALLLSLLLHYAGLWGVIKFWLMPWVAYHLWKSFFISAAFRLPFTGQEATIRLSFPKRYPGWIKLASNDFAFLLSATRFLSYSIQEHKGRKFIPNCHLKNAFALISLKHRELLDVENALDDEKEKIRLQEAQKELDLMKDRLDFGTPPQDLPPMTWEEFKAVGKAKRLVVCDEIVFDIYKFYFDHPGGQLILDRFLGHDITAVFNGGIYNHSNGARNLARRMMIARLVDRPKQ